jgi:Rrf2 family transcriptional regulator, nitric oxide-sensitive transcriptional repressor
VISQTVEYALRATVLLADEGQGSRTVDEIAEATRVPKAYLSKVMQGLHRAGLVTSQRGLHGGFRLAKPPAEVSILEVVNAVERLQRIRTCPLGLAAHGVRLCPLHKRLDDALAMVEQAFANSTLAEIIADPNPSVPLCDFPKLPPAESPATVTPSPTGP